MFNKIKEWIMNKVEKIKNALFETVWEVKGWVIHLLGVLIGWQVASITVHILRNMSTAIIITAGYYAIAAALLLIFTAIFMSKGLIDIHIGKKWRVVS